MAEIRELGRKTREESRRFRDDLRRWAALDVKEARHQRMRQREIDLNITRLSAAQLVTEEKPANLIASLANGRAASVFNVEIISPFAGAIRGAPAPTPIRSTTGWSLVS